MKKKSESIELSSIRISGCTEELEACRNVLTAAEAERAERFIQPADRDRFIICRGLLRRTLARRLNTAPCSIEFIRNEHGKPYLPGGELEFNVSHSRDRLLIAVTSDRAVGVDIEFRRDGVPMEAIAKRWFSPAECAFFQTLKNPRDGFFDIWAKKEAYVKALGRGIFQELNSFSVPLGGAPDVSWVDHIDGWAFQTLNIDPDYAAAIVSKTPAAPVQLRNFTS